MAAKPKRFDRRRRVHCRNGGAGVRLKKSASGPASIAVEDLSAENDE
jgi:hypothetical protein